MAYYYEIFCKRINTNYLLLKPISDILSVHFNLSLTANYYMTVITRRPASFPSLQDSNCWKGGSPEYGSSHRKNLKAILLS